MHTGIKVKSNKFVTFSSDNFFLFHGCSVCIFFFSELFPDVLLTRKYLRAAFRAPNPNELVCISHDVRVPAYSFRYFTHHFCIRYLISRFPASRYPITETECLSKWKNRIPFQEVLSELTQSLRERTSDSPLTAAIHGGLHLQSISGCFYRRYQASTGVLRELCIFYEKVTR